MSCIYFSKKLLHLLGYKKPNTEVCAKKNKNFNFNRMNYMYVPYCISAEDCGVVKMC